MQIESDLTTSQKTILPDLLGEVILEQEGKAIFDVVELLRAGFIQQRRQPDQKKMENLIEQIKEMDSESLHCIIHAFFGFPRALHFCFCIDSLPKWCSLAREVAEVLMRRKHCDNLAHSTLVQLIALRQQNHHK